MGEAVLTSTHNLCFEQKYEKITEFSSENFQFLVVKFSIYLNRCVFVMKELGTLTPFNRLIIIYLFYLFILFIFFRLLF